ncbi:MAG TPA: TIGR00282 family metallophosphoesterase [Candidatus Saccharimonadales bacterium]|nr:TIGR00282 family metallophosphoesterase [Candidatus Saccharimonadales bacterium]
MNILYIGDVMGEMGLQAVEKILPGLRAEHSIGLVIAQAENLSEGRGVLPEDFKRLQQAGVDFGTAGNWTTWHDETTPLLEDPAVPLLRPANYPDAPGPRYKYARTPKGDVLVVSLMGQVVGRDADKLIKNPLQAIDAILADEPADKRIATVVNLHGDFSSEKFIIGYYLDGRASIVVGDHWHVPTADADVLPKGTAHMTDVGMCGSLDSSLGVTFDSVLPRWRDGIQTRNQLETTGRTQFNALLVTIDETTGKAMHAESIRKVW